MTEIFVFGSNLAGRHGAGSAKEAVRNWGASYGQAVGRQGNAWAIPTKDFKLRVLPIERIRYFVDLFNAYAHMHPELSFRCVAIGCGLAGYEPKDIAPLFARSPANVMLPLEFIKVLNP